MNHLAAAISILLLVALCTLLAGCGGTFVLKPDGSLSYTTPELIKPSSSK